MKSLKQLVLFAVCCLAASSRSSAADIETLLKQLSDSSESVRRAAWEGAADQGASAIAQLAALSAADNREAALAASRAIDRIAHASAAPGVPHRTDVAAALAATLDDVKLSVAVKLHSLDLLSSVGESAVVPSIAKTLADTQLRDFARKALERIPGEAAEKALASALAGASGEFREALIGTLGMKRAKSAVPTLTRIALEEGGPRVAAAKALARVGDPSGVEAIHAVIKVASPRDRTALTDDLLQMADGLRRSGDAATARKIYSSVLAGQDETRRYAALFALYGAGEEKDTAALLAAVDDASPRVRALALELLAAWKGEDVNGLLSSRLQAAKGSEKAAFLRVLAARKAPGVEKMLEAAAGDPEVDVRVTALELAGKLGDPSIEPLLIQALEKGSAAVKDIAAGACLDLADVKAGKDAAGAVALYRRIFDASKDARNKGRALVGLGRAGDADSLAKIEAARKDPALGPSASQAYVAYATVIGKAGKKEEAISMLQSVISAGAPRETVQAAITSLKELGGDPGVLQKKQGFIVAWKIVGPFPNKDGKGFDAVFSPEEELHFDGKQKDERGRDRKWEDFVSPNIDGKVDLRQVFQRSNDVCAYAYAELVSPEARDVRLAIGSDDGVVCWLNGKKIHSNNTTRGWTPDQDVVSAHLEAGANKILLKVTQGGGEWEFSFRVTDSKDQRPIDLTAFKK